MSSDNIYYCHEYDDTEPFSADEVRAFLHRENAGWAECRLDDGWTRFLASVPLPGTSREKFLLSQSAGRELDGIRHLGGILCGAWEENT